MTNTERSASFQWDDVARRLHALRTIWLGTVSADGAPHAAPVWLAVVGDEAYVFTSGASVKARNLRIDPRAVLHSENGEDVLIVHGRLEFVGDPRDFPRVTAGFAEKYRNPGDDEFLPGQDPTADALFRVIPARALSWRLEDFAGSQRRWSSTG